MTSYAAQLFTNAKRGLRVDDLVGDDKGVPPRADAGAPSERGKKRIHAAAPHAAADAGAPSERAKKRIHSAAPHAAADAGAPFETERSNIVKKALKKAIAKKDVVEAMRVFLSSDGVTEAQKKVCNKHMLLALVIISHEDKKIDEHPIHECYNELFNLLKLFKK